MFHLSLYPYPLVFQQVINNCCSEDGQMGQKIGHVDRWIVGFIKLLSHQRKKEVQVILRFCIEVLTSPQEDTDLSFFYYLFLYPSDNNFSYLSVTAGNLLSSEGKYMCLMCVHAYVRVCALIPKKTTFVP